MRTIVIWLMCAVVFIGVTADLSAQISKELEDEIMTAVGYYDAGQDAKAFDALGKILRENQDVLNHEQTELMKEFFIFSAYALAQRAADREDEETCLKYSLGAMEFGKPDYSLSEETQRYPVLFYIAAASLQKLGRETEAETYYRKANELSEEITATEYRSVLDEMKAFLAPHITPNEPFPVGGYVTNQGATQRWIGRIMEKEGNVLSVKITYCNGGTDWNGEPLCSYGVGETSDFLADEVQELTHVSLDASIRGYK